MTGWQPAARNLLVRTDAEYERAHRRFDSLDTKAGLVLGIAATLLGLTLDVTVEGDLPRCLLAAGRGAGIVTVLAALGAAWPRTYKRLDLALVRRRLEEDDPDLVLLDLADQLIENVSSVADAANAKLRWLTAALTLLTAATAMTAAAALLS